MNFHKHLYGSNIGEEVANTVGQNQDPIRTDLEKLSGHRGQFDGFIVFGIQLRAPDGIVSWKINMWNDDGHADYWVTGNEFRMVGTHIFDPSANGATTYAVGPVIDAPEEERSAIKAALKFWRENPLSPDALAES